MSEEKNVLKYITFSGDRVQPEISPNDCLHIYVAHTYTLKGYLNFCKS